MKVNKETLGSSWEKRKPNSESKKKAIFNCFNFNMVNIG